MKQGTTRILIILALLLAVSIKTVSGGLFREAKQSSNTNKTKKPKGSPKTKAKKMKKVKSSKKKKKNEKKKKKTKSPKTTVFCEPDEDIIHFELETDGFPDETAWTLANFDNGNILHSVPRGNYTEPFKLYEETLCVPSSLCYEFTVYDSWGDGILSSGYYNISYEGDIIVRGGYFEFSETSVFGDTCPSASPSVSSQPSSIPTTSSSPSASSQPSSAPTMVCEPDEDIIYLELMTDRFPKHTAWTLANFEDGTVLHSVPRKSYTYQKTRYEETLCVPSSLCYEFTIFDLWLGNGINRPGYYKVTYEGDVVKQGGGIYSNFGQNETSIFGKGNVCPSASPSISSQPSSIPTTAPSSSPSESSLPSASPVEAGVQLCSEVLRELNFYYYESGRNYCYRISLSTNESAVYQSWAGNVESSCNFIDFSANAHLGSASFVTIGSNHFTGGDICSVNGVQRNTKVDIVEANVTEAKLIEVTEPSICSYEAILEIPFCDPKVY